MAGPWRLSNGGRIEPAPCDPRRRFLTTCRLRDWEGAHRSHARSRSLASGAVLYTTVVPSRSKREFFRERCGLDGRALDSRSNDASAMLITRASARAEMRPK